MSIEMVQPKPGTVRAIQILKHVLVQGQPFGPGAQIRVPESDAYDLVHHGQAKFLTAAEVGKK
jgi:hypothetical protein